MFNKYLVSISTFFLFFLIIFTAIPHAKANTITVGRNNEDFSSIQDAIDSAENEDSILISAGVYEENLIVDKNNLELIGENKNDVILKSKNPKSGDGIEIIDTDGDTNLKILNLTIQDFLYGIYGARESSEISNVLISNVHLISNGDTELPENCTQNNPYQNCSLWHDQGASIKFKNLTNSKIENNIIENGERGILIFNVSATSANNEISFNQIFGNQQYGIRLNNASSDNVIYRNNIYDNKSEGIEIYRTDNNLDENITIKQNQIYQNSNDGIRIENIKNATISQNKILKNASSVSVPYSPGTDPAFGGIYLNNVINSVISENDIDENSFEGINLGIDSANNSILNNSIKNHLTTPQATDNGSFNNFDHGSIGNYWSDQDHGLNYYDVSGTALNKDNYPLESPPVEITNNKVWIKVDEYKPQSIKFAWNNSNLTNFSEYQIEITNEETNKKTVWDKDKTISLSDEETTEIEIFNLDPDNLYSAKISVLNSDNSDNLTSDILYFKTTFLSQIPSSPKNINSTSITQGKALIYWFPNPNSENISYYEVYKKADNGDYEYFKKVISPNTYLYDDSLNLNKTYTYKLRAKNNFGFSTFSSETTVVANTVLSLNSDNHINVFSENDIQLNTVVSKTEDLKSELLFTPKLAEEISDNPVSVFGLNANLAENDFRIVNLDYSSISEKIYYYSISDLQSTINLENLPTEALISIKYTNDDIGSLNEDFLSIALYDQVKQRWLPLLSEINPNSNVITARTNYLGVFKILYKNKPISFHDISPTDWVYGYVQNLNRSSIINGYSDNSFRPEYLATRAEVLKMSLLASGFKIPLFVFEKPCLDIETDKWYATYFQFGMNKNIMSGYEDKTCKPNQNITRAETLKIILGKKGKDYDATYVPFDDFESIPTWAISYIRYALDHQIINGYSDNTFRPDSPISRQELAKILYESYRLE